MTSRFWEVEVCLWAIKDTKSDEEALRHVILHFSEKASRWCDATEEGSTQPDGRLFVHCIKRCSTRCLKTCHARCQL